mmetsp:Transcript_37389/g.94339  ORF Transcript_37389/g.94339 Transcript_37389/m.94339 type:complete len:391 (-) Transcript_37389:1048-2220(-)
MTRFQYTLQAPVTPYHTPPVHIPAPPPATAPVLRLVLQAVASVPLCTALDAVQRGNAQQVEAGAHDARGRLAQQQPAVLVLTANHLAVHVERVELLAQLVQVVGQPVGRQLLEHVLHRLGQLGQVQRQLGLARVRQGDLTRLCQGLDVTASLAHNAGDARVSVQQVHRGVALEVQHGVVAELVVGHAVVLEVRVLDGAVAHGARGRLQLCLVDRLARLGPALADGGLAARLGLVQQLHQAHHIARPRLELLAVLAQHQAKAHVVDARLGGPVALGGQPPGLARGGKHHVKVLLLPAVGHVHDPVRLLRVHAVPDGGHVGGRVAEAAVALLHDQRHLLPLHKHAHRALVHLSDALLLELLHNALEEGVVERLAALRQLHAQAVVQRLELLA